MELIDLNVFAAVVEHRTTTQAARVLGMTQPGASKHLTHLEREMGGQLFDRIGKYLVLNEFGKLFYERTKKILGEVHKLSEMSYGSTSPVGALRLGLTDAATLIVTPPSLNEFRQRYPGVHISLDVDSSKLIEERVLNGDYDLGIITAGLSPHPRLDQEALYDDTIDAVVATTHPLARRQEATLSELAGHPLIISPRRRRTRAIIEAAFRNHNILIHDTIDVYHHTAAVRLAEAGLGVALLPRTFITREIPRRRCAHIQISGDPIARTLCMIQRKNEERSEIASTFHDIVMKSIHGLYPTASPAQHCPSAPPRARPYTGNSE